MFRKKNSNDESNFWISYADLMAGLLFVFILLIGAIVSKSIIIKNNLHEKENKLIESKKDIIEKKKLISTKDKNLTDTKKILTLKIEEIKKLNKMLLITNTQQDVLNKKIIFVQNILKENDNTMQLKSKDFSNKLQRYEGKIILLSNQLTQSNTKIENQDKELLKLLNALDEKGTKYDNLIIKLQSQKAKIKSLTGIKLKVITALKDELGKHINIDKKSGSLAISSNILFDKGSDILKQNAKLELKKIFVEYISILINNPKIKPHLDKIIIEGHTDSDGEYLFNLNLSQRRAFSVMNYLLNIEFSKKHHIEPLMVASGRAYLDTIQVNGIENKNASRRIEVKFRLKNEDTIQEIEKILDAK